MMKKNTVSVVMITYGHEKFIEQAINGVLMQKCNFDYELIIANDCSPDNTDLIIKNFIKNNPLAYRIKYTAHKHNIGMMPNFMFALESAKGKYIALCEGDDYWTDPNKLQKQVDILEASPDLAISFHNVKVYNEFENTETDFYSMLRKDKPSQITTLNTLLNGNYISTLSVVFRNNHFKLPAEFKKFTVGDWPLHILNARYGDVYFLDEVMAVYRIHSGGVHQNGRGWSFKRKFKEIDGELTILKFLKEILDNKFQRKITDKIKYLYKLKILLLVKRYLMFEKSF